MSDFEEFLAHHAKYEKKKSEEIMEDPRTKILVHSGALLNWHGDFLGNPEIKHQKKKLPVDKIQFTGTNLEWNEILLVKCERSPARLRELIRHDSKIKGQLLRETSFDYEPICVRDSEERGFYKVWDGMHRFVGKVLKGEKEIWVWHTVNEDETLPYCEAHTVYDLIRGFQRNAHDKLGKKDLIHGLRLLNRTYANVKGLLLNRFNINYVFDEEVQDAIRQALK